MIAIIPARFASTRFPGKPLALLHGKPVIQHVCERCLESRLLSAVYVATDDKRIMKAVECFGGKAIMTSKRHQSGTDRIAEALAKLGQTFAPETLILNVQGDEPLIDSKTISALLKQMQKSNAAMGSLMTVITDPEMLDDPNTVKVITGKDGYAIYFSRSGIPFNRDKLPGVTYYRHIGVYAYRLDTLQQFVRIPVSRLEKIEKLEQLRALENGIPILMVQTTYQGLGIDTPSDLARIEAL